MSSTSKRLKVHPVRMDQPDLRRLARVLIELALAEQAVVDGDDKATSSASKQRGVA